MRLAVGLLAAIWSLSARAEVRFQIDLSNASHLYDHSVEISMVVEHAASPLILWMPVWTPGAYELRTWGRNVTPVSATAKDAALTFHRVDPSRFEVDGHQPGDTVRLIYRVYAPLLSDDSSQIDASHAYLNGSSIFLTNAESLDKKQRVELSLPTGWKIATALTPAENSFTAVDYQELIDAPIEAGKFVERTRTQHGITIRVAVHGDAQSSGDPVPIHFFDRVFALLDAEIKHVGAAPFHNYLILIHRSNVLGKLAALEHARSCSIVLPADEREEVVIELYYAIAHEMFHAWNARKLRPADLTPYDLTRIQTSRSLWFSEGFSDYYAHLVMRETELWSDGKYRARLSEQLTRAAEVADSGLTAAESSQLAWQVPDELAEDTAFYARGQVIAYGLDAAIRQQSGGKRSLDDVMKNLLSQTSRGPLAVDGAVLTRAVESISGPTVAKYVRAWSENPREVDAIALATNRSFTCRSDPPKPELGFGVGEDDDHLSIAILQPGGPAAIAGLKVGDRIVSIDGVEVSDPAFKSKSQWKANKPLRLRVIRLGEPLDFPLTPRERSHRHCELSGPEAR